MHETDKAYIALLKKRIEELEAKVNMVQGWWYAQACSMLDKGEDIRQVPLPDLVEQCERDLAQEGK